MKTIYYFVGLMLLGYELMFLIGFKGQMKRIKAYWDYKKDHEVKTEDWDNLPDDVKNTRILGVFVGIPLILWLLGGLLTFNWLLFVFYWVYFFIIVALKEISRPSSIYSGIVFFDTLVSIVFIAFVIINSYHLHIDLWQYFKSNIL